MSGRGAALRGGIWALIVAQGALSLFFLVLVILWGYEWLVIAPLDAPVFYVVAVCGCLVPHVAMSARARSLVAPAPRRWVVFAFAAASGLAVAGYLLIARGAAHDIALWLGSHGRFGCTLVDEAGRRVTWLDDRTLPWILSMPVPLTYLGWLALRARAVRLAELGCLERGETQGARRQGDGRLRGSALRGH